MTAARHDRVRADVAALAAALAAVPLGLVAATEGRLLVLGAVAGLALALATARWFRRDPVMLLAALWAFQIVRTPLAAATQSAPVAGTLIDQLTDLCLLVILLALAWEALSPNAPRRDLRFLLPALGLAACGLTGSLLQHAPLGPTLEGLWLGTKFWLLVGVAVAAAWRPDDAARLLRVLVPLGAGAAGLGLLDAATGGAVADVFNSNLRVTPFGTYRSEAAQSLYSHPNEYSLAMSVLVAIWLARVATFERVLARDVVLLCLFVAAAVVSLRLKAVLSVTAVFAIVAAVQLLRGRRHALTVLAGGAVSLVLILAFMGDVVSRQLDTYSTVSERQQLYGAGARIAEERFPWGVGFGRFGSAPSRDTYSTVYDDYGLSRVYGLSRDFPRFITDTSWPSVMGETGYAGLAVFLAGLGALLAIAVRALRAGRGPDDFAPLAMLCVLAVLVVDSAGNPTLFSWNGSTPVALVAGALLAQHRAGAAARAGARAHDPPPLRLERSLANADRS